MAKNLIPNSVYQTLRVVFPSAMADDAELRLNLTLDVKDGVAIGMSGGGIYEGEKYIGSFYGLCGFAHDVTGEKKEAVDALLSDLSDTLAESYGVPLPAQMEEPAHEEPTGEGE